MSCEPMLDVVADLPDRREGKVRVSFRLPDDGGGARRLFVTTDRLSAFDRVIAGVPYKGQVLNQLAAWWFANTADLVDNHVIPRQHPEATRRRHRRETAPCTTGLALFEQGVRHAKET